MMHDMQILRITYSVCRKGMDGMENFGENEAAQGIFGQTRTILTILLSNAILSQGEDVYHRP